MSRDVFRRSGLSLRQLIGTTDVGQPVILIPSWLHFIMPPKHVAAQRTFCLQLFLLQIVCGHWLLPFDSDSGNMHGLEPVKTRIDGDESMEMLGETKKIN